MGTILLVAMRGKEEGKVEEGITNIRNDRSLWNNEVVGKSRLWRLGSRRWGLPRWC